MKLLLDTCTFLWVVAGARELSPRVQDFVRDPANEVYLSVASSWEIAVKHGLGRLPLPASPERFVPAERTHLGVESLALDEESVLYVHRLPTLHRDPFDRVLICQSIVHGLTILTPDPLLTQYPVRCLW